MLGYDLVFSLLSVPCIIVLLQSPYAPDVVSGYSLSSITVLPIVSQCSGCSLLWLLSVPSITVYSRSSLLWLPYVPIITVLPQPASAPDLVFYCYCLSPVSLCFHNLPTPEIYSSVVPRITVLPLSPSTPDLVFSCYSLFPVSL